ncbi:MAG: AAA family ATPase [Microcystis aeruginosa K13-05]|jgi:AAA15 family ATPase/GTPase|uniref:ATPase AAA-type core domain-containing protein n=2 Tax=Microcystis TaxID=1125 RepID=I4FTN0_MICAE|nr:MULTISPECIES: AAA family ATPase [Microcystis]MCE2661464.1 AAA family ATPase [Microcystis sp. 53602_E8]MCZ8362362.1 AAA family ATPase [Microcystis sp. LE19-251.1A]NCR80983.1 AAA family ATPase [Microcystis aeruginosa K13-10]NCR85583.1 AAA family ATPase [Microcystis aeruginosa K13-05]MCZ8024690.1 AAA family ATPase [Microcystis sp. LE19-10.1B]
MKLLRLSYQDLSSGLSIDSCKFFPDLNLLVGISGAGKTSILKAISNLKRIANGESINGVKWDVEFLTNDHVRYHWLGEFEVRKARSLIKIEEDEVNSNDGENKVSIIRETLLKDQEVLIARNQEVIEFKHSKTPKLASYLSCIELFNQEEDVFPVRQEFNKMVFNPLKFNISSSTLDKILRDYEYTSLSELQSSQLPISDKLLITYKKYPDTFEIIKRKFLDIFPQVEDLKIEFLEPFKLGDIGMLVSLTPIFLLEDLPRIQIKEKNSHVWIVEPNISSGMIKSLMFLATIKLSPDGSVILIDEFENSLGVNCLDTLTEDLLVNYRDLQFIITSHHPYIINNISPAYWKIVTRKGGVIQVHNAADFHISKTRQKAFIDLINVLEEFPQGIS